MTRELQKKKIKKVLIEYSLVIPRTLYLHLPALNHALCKAL